MGRTFQIVFITFGLAMLLLLGWNVSADAWTPLNWSMLAVSGVCCFLAFIRLDHAFTFSYALAMAVNACLIASALLSPVAVLLAAIAVLYGIRLVTFTWFRSHSRAYAKHLEKLVAADAAAPGGGKLFIWVATTLLYAFHAMPVFAAASRGVLSGAILPGALLMLAGLLLEAFADRQMQTAKHAAPENFVNRGLFATWRHPNYFGQVILQGGLIMVGLSSVSTIPAAATVVIAPIYIIVLMAFEAHRRDREQLARYGHDSDYIAYRKISGSLLPRLRRLP